MSDNAQRVIKLIAQVIGRSNEADQIKPEMTLDEIGADSLDTVEIVMDLEEVFKIEIADHDADGVTTVQGFVDIVERQLTAAA